MAGIAAVALNGGWNLNNNALYSLYTSSGKYLAAFHDVYLSGNNGYSVQAGWDAVTGLGSINFQNFADIFYQSGGVMLTGQSLSPSIITAGQSFTMSYTISNPNPSYSLNQIGLGASIRLHGTTNEATDASHDIYVSLPGGANTQTRQFVTSSSLTTGYYDVNWLIWMGPPGLGNALYSSGWQMNQLQIVTQFTQYQVTFGYQVSGGGSPTAPSVTYISLGSQYSVTAGQSATVWADSGSTYTYTPNPLTGSSGNERWQASAGTSGTISSSATIAPTYYHQYLMTLSYSVSGGGSPTAPTFTANRFGSSTPVTLTGSLTGSWFDADASWTVTNPLTGSSSTERWATSTGSGTVSAAATIAFAYYHQFSLTFSYSTPGGAVASTAPTLTSTQFGVAYAPVLTGSAAAYWLDNGAAWSVTNPLGGSGVSERWDSSQTVSGTVSATQTAVFTYYHQYSITPYYTVSDSSSPSVTNVVSYTQFGSPLTVTPTLGSSGGSAVWVDAGTAVTYY